MDSLKDKVAIVTGASSGIGLATARLFAEYGAKVALVARSKDKLEALAQELPGSLAVVCDIAEPSSVALMVKKVHEHYGRIDILINNAGRGYDCPLESIDLDEYVDLIRLNVVGQLATMQAVFPIMKAQGSGSIVSISSGLSHRFMPNVAAYSSTKRALNGLTLTAREEWAKHGIVVTLVHPLITNTDFFYNKASGRPPEGVANPYLNGDPPEAVAMTIMKSVSTGEAELFVREW